MTSDKKRPDEKVIANNKKAFHDFTILDKYETGMVLLGTEVKSLRQGKCSIRESFARIENGEVFIYDLHIPPYDMGSVMGNHDPVRPRKLLMHRHEIERLMGKVKEKGLTLVPIKLYFSRGKAKLELGLAKGKAIHDKRKAIAERDANRDVDRALRERTKGGR